MVRLWRHIDKEDVAKIMEELLPTPHFSSDYLESLYQSEDNSEELLFNVKSVIFLSFIMFSKTRYRYKD